MIIGISGKRMSGKDSVADYLCKKHGFKKIAFADKLKEIARCLFGWDGNKDEKGRTLLQDIGRAFRLIEENVWINYALKDIDLNQNYITTDVRYMNEAKIIKFKGGVLWRIDRNLNRNVEASKLELYRRKIGKYEDTKIMSKENGDVYTLHSPF